MYKGFWKIIVYVHRQRDLPLGRSDMFFVTKYILANILPKLGRGRRLRNVFWQRRVRTNHRWNEGVGAGGGHLGSNARARRSLAFAILVSLTSPLGARLEATQDGGGSQPEERHGLAAEVLMIIRRRKNSVRGVLGKIFPCPPSLEERRLDPCVLPAPPLVCTRLSIGCLRQCA
jgi:hypothetical protein